MKKLSVLFLMVCVLVSCTNDGSSTNDNQDAQMTGYEIRSKSVFQDPDVPTIERVTVANFQNGKPFSEAVENFQNGISDGSPVTTQTHFYNGDLLISKAEENSNRITDFYYDSGNNIIGAKMTLYNTGVNHYRFIPVSQNVVYFERISLPYDDSSATIYFRIIVEFDAHDNVIRAGRDNNQDGVAEFETQFSYVDDNLVSISRNGGTVENFAYSNVIDNFSALYDSMYGKRNGRILDSEMYVSGGPEHRSKNIASDDLSDNVYEVMDTNYYKKRTVVKNYTDPVGQNTTTTEFFFD